MSPQRNRWHWLADLVDRAGSDRAAVRDALAWLGWPEAQVIEGIATILDVTPHRLEHPDDATVARVDPQRLAAVLPRLLEDDRPRLRAIGASWLECPGVAYQLPPSVLEDWLRSTGAAAAALRARVDPEGLAMLGSDALRRLANEAAEPTIRAAAQRWVARFA